MMLIAAMLIAASAVADATQTASSAPLEKTYWRVIELPGTPIPKLPASREAHLIFDGAGRLSGSDGCSRITGTYQLVGPAIKVSPVTPTQTACSHGDQVARALRAALASAHVVHRSGEQLDLLDTSGTRLVRFMAGKGSTPAAAAQAALPGTWQLVKVLGGAGRTVSPDDRSKYMVAFTADGHLTARIDCNRGRGAWTATGPGQVRFEPLALTRAACPAGSLHDRIVKDWSAIHTYKVKNGHLFLSLTTGGGSYEFEPVVQPGRDKEGV